MERARSRKEDLLKATASGARWVSAGTMVLVQAVEEAEEAMEQ